MATGQDLLNLMEVLDNELHLQSGEPDVARALRALNASQDLFESVVAGHPNVLGDTIGTVAITAGSESTAFPTSLLRLDKLYMLDAATNRPIYELDRFDRVGGQAQNRRWPLSLLSVTPSGRVAGYWTDGSQMYWSPFPGQSDTVRWYGFASAADITAGGTFTYRDIVMLPVASFATQLMRAGWGDDSMDLAAATAAFTPTVKALANFNRDRAPGFLYRQVHTT